jgi:thioredoxin reductase (NADPH)
VIGASYIALECGGFLNGLGNDVTMMIRSIFLRGFDRQVANKLAEYMHKKGVKFIRNAIPIRI